MLGTINGTEPRTLKWGREGPKNGRNPKMDGTHRTLDPKNRKTTSINPAKHAFRRSQDEWLVNKTTSIMFHQYFYKKDERVYTNTKKKLRKSVSALTIDMNNELLINHLQYLYIVLYSVYIYISPSLFSAIFCSQLYFEKPKFELFI